MRIYLIRHGKKEPEGENPPLTKEGIRQAKHLAKKIRKLKFDKFYSSDLTRSIQTAEIVSKKIKLKFTPEPLLREFEIDVFRKDKNKWKKEERAQYNGLIHFIDNLIRDKNEEKNLLIIAHGFINRAIMSYLLKMPLKRFIAFRQSEVCLNVLHWSEKYKSWHLEKMNDNSHVPKSLK
jgi:broad specificity phosphatase PhoE